VTFSNFFRFYISIKTHEVQLYNVYVFYCRGSSEPDCVGVVFFLENPTIRTFERNPATSTEAVPVSPFF
jgi:hypothetical protein